MRFYKNGNCIVCISSDGTKIRQCSDERHEPSFAENIDVKITEKCASGCVFCYENCTPAGKHADLDSYGFIDHLHPFTEISINGNDINHPQMDKFLERVKRQQVFANITVNQRQFMNSYEKLAGYQEAGVIYGIGVSYEKFDKDFIDRFMTIRNGVLHTIVGIITEDDIKKLSGYGFNLLFLGFKDVGRGKKFKETMEASIEANTQMLKELIPNLEEQFRTVCFDNLALDQLDVKNMIPKEQWDKLYMGDDGTFTFYIDLVNGTFARNSISGRKMKVMNRNIDEMFRIIRNLKH